MLLQHCLLLWTTHSGNNSTNQKRLFHQCFKVMSATRSPISNKHIFYLICFIVHHRMGAHPSCWFLEWLHLRWGNSINFCKAFEITEYTQLIFLWVLFVLLFLSSTNSGRNDSSLENFRLWCTVMHIHGFVVVSPTPQADWRIDPVSHYSEIGTSNHLHNIPHPCQLTTVFLDRGLGSKWMNWGHLFIEHVHTRLKEVIGVIGQSRK